MSPRAEQYRRDAATCLRQAINFREIGRQTGAAIDRVIMRRFALEWRNYTRLAQSW